MISTAKENTQGLITVEARVSAKFMVNKKEFLRNQEETIQRALNEGNAYFSQCDDYFPGPWNEEELGFDEDISFELPGGMTKLPHHVFSHIDRRIEEIENKTQTSDPAEALVLKRLLQELKGIQALYK